MARISLIYAGVSAANSLLRSSIKETQQIVNEMEIMKKNIEPELRQKHQIDRQLQICCQLSEDIYAQSNQLLNATEYGLEKYKALESRLQRIIPDSF